LEVSQLGMSDLIANKAKGGPMLKLQVPSLRMADPLIHSVSLNQPKFAPVQVLAAVSWHWPHSS